MLPWFTRLPEIVYAATPNKSPRSTQDVRLVVVHDPEGGYEGTRAFILRPSAQVSYHVLLDEEAKKGTQFVPWALKSWSVARYNSRSDNISIAGFRGNDWSYPALNRLARTVAFRLHKRNLPATFLSAPLDPDNPPYGFTFHSELGPEGGGHHDPGLTGAKKAFFIASVKFQRRVGKFRRSWGRD